MAPDEFIIITALKQLRLVRSVQRVEVKPHMRYPPGTLLNSYPTFVVFPAVSSPHPVLWTHLDKKVRCQVRVESRQGGSWLAGLLPTPGGWCGKGAAACDILSAALVTVLRD
jgi:hypothetical protein